MRKLYILPLALLGVLFALLGCSNSNMAQDEVRHTQMMLHDIWVLTAVDGTAIDAAKLSGDAPRLEIFVKEQRYFAFAGCNNVQGSLSLEGETITFEPGPMTLMACPNMELEQQFTQRLFDGTLLFQRTGGQLVLMTGDNTSLSFKRVD